jgi:biotin carboxyl carrier protein
MQYDIDIAGQRRHVVVTRDGDAFTVAVDGRSWQVDAARIGTGILSLLMSRRTPPPAADAWTSHEVTIAADPSSGDLTVRVGDAPLTVGLDTRRRAGRKDDGAHAGAGPQRIVAPMPGKVVRVLVRIGDVVAPRQGLVVVEAMKMENELRAARSGTVTEVQAREAMSVDTGTLLVVIA